MIEREDEAMTISRDEVKKISELARLRFEEEELTDFTSRFQDLLEYIEKLKEVDVEAIAPTSHVTLTKEFEKHIFREDEVRPSLDVEDSLANAPDPGNGHFRVPKVI
jgi:aspartyl-tRNA(Asn)/glutamyl-tRNA(Gln) amidotransferase subunit C